jgi:uncharacterized damage-inducible protein DinB
VNALLVTQSSYQLGSLVGATWLRLVGAQRLETFPSRAAKLLDGGDSMRLIVPAFLVCAALLVAGPAAAQQPQHPETVRDVYLAGWTEIGGKLVKMAEEFPENKFDYKPAEGVRTFADVLRHVAFWNEWVAKRARGEKPDGKPNELSKTEFNTKAKIVEALKTSIAQGAAELKKQPASPDARQAELWASFIAHSSEHYGQLVVYYRLNGLVPPASRATN